MGVHLASPCRTIRGKGSCPGTFAHYHRVSKRGLLTPACPRSPTPASGGLSYRASTIAIPRILFPPASASIPSRTPAPPPPEDAVGSGYADTINSYPAQTASHTGLRDYTVRLMKWRERHCLCRRCDSQGKGSNGDRPDHFFSSLFWGSLTQQSSPSPYSSPSSRFRRSLSFLIIKRLRALIGCHHLSVAELPAPGTPHDTLLLLPRLATLIAARPVVAALPLAPVSVWVAMAAALARPSRDALLPTLPPPRG
jgi:hypothetical protein